MADPTTIFIGGGAVGDDPRDPGSETISVSDDPEWAWDVALRHFPHTAALEGWTLGEEDSSVTIRWMEDGGVRYGGAPLAERVNGGDRG